MTKRKILITGASIAGPAIAYFLSCQGNEVTVVEWASEFRDGGQTVDIRGAGRTVIRYMGLEDAIRAQSTGEQGIAFVDKNNKIKAKIGVNAYNGEGPIAELEILRGELGRLLIAHSQDKVTYRFNDYIVTIEDDGRHVHIGFASGRKEIFDLLIIAEGIGSQTRNLVFGNMVKRRKFDLYTAYFTIPRSQTDDKLMRWFNAPGGRNVCLRPDNLGTTRVLMSFQEPPHDYEKRTPEAQKKILQEKFGDAGWEVPRILSALDDTKDLYLEAVGQVKMDHWSKGRVVLLGDAGYCASPISGMGTSLALCGAYVLAGELDHHIDPTEAFTAYEKIMRPFVNQAQKVPKIAPRLASPHSRIGISIGHAVLRMINMPGFKKLLSPLLSPKADAIDLPDY